MSACRLCLKPGFWCALGLVERYPGSCVVCTKATYLRSRCGAWRCRADHPLPAGAVVEPEPEQTPAAARPPTVAQEPAPLRLLKLLESAEYMPRRKHHGKMIEPYWRPELPGMTSAVHAPPGWGWRRPFDGDTLTLDRNFAYGSAASSALVGFRQLEHTGECEFDPNRSGYGLVQVHPWHEKAMPSPLGNARRDTAWVPWPTIQLLSQLSDAGRWADAAILDSYTSEGVRLTAWTDRIKEIRASILDRHGPLSDAYKDFKIAFGQVFGLLVGAEQPGQARKWKCRAQRPDWAHTIIAQASATLWRDADKCLRLLPDAGPVALANTDELVIPAESFEALTEGDKPVLRIDPTGKRLGTFKVKA